MNSSRNCVMNQEWVDSFKSSTFGDDLGKSHVLTKWHFYPYSLAYYLFIQVKYARFSFISLENLWEVSSWSASCACKIIIIIIIIIIITGNLREPLCGHLCTIMYDLPSPNTAYSTNCLHMSCKIHYILWRVPIHTQKMKYWILWTMRRSVRTLPSGHVTVSVTTCLR